MRNARLRGCAAVLTVRARSRSPPVSRTRTRSATRRRTTRRRPARRSSPAPASRRWSRAWRRARRARAPDGLGARRTRRPAPLARLLRAAHGLPARRRGVARARGVRRPRARTARSARRRHSTRGRSTTASAAEPVHAGQPSRAGRRGPAPPMDLALLTGDQSDNQQYNETLWVRQLIEGGKPLTPNSGIKSDYSECTPASQAELQARETAGQIPDEPTYMGVQDYDDLGFRAPDYYDPDEPVRRPVRHLPDLAGPDGPRPVAHLHAGRAAPRRHAGAHLRLATATTTAWCRATRTRSRPSRTSRPAASRSRPAPRRCRSARTPTRTSSSRRAPASRCAPTSRGGASWTGSS